MIPGLDNYGNSVPFVTFFAKWNYYIYGSEYTPNICECISSFGDRGAMKSLDTLSHSV